MTGMSPAEVAQAMGPVNEILDAARPAFDDRGGNVDVWRLWCEHEPACDDEQECDRLTCELCLDGQPCIEHRAQARESAAREAAERSRS